MTRKLLANATVSCPRSRNPLTVGGEIEEMDTAEKQNTPSSAGSRPTLVSHTSNSLPSTPYQRPRNRESRSRSPSTERGTLNASPKSSHSDSSRSLSTLRRRTGGCKYEAGMARARRRVPYSLGPDKLEPELAPLKQKLSPAEDDKLSGDMRELYDRLLPSEESENRRRRLVRKLEKLLNDRWPGHDITVHVFGSSGNNLGTTDSDVDICITTDWKELEQVCTLAEFLASHGMERVVCVSSAKVPIVKIWDPELQLACDMNVNNTVALENTELIRSYVALDERVRPLAMIIKYWTRRRILNDAALGGTLSSYTWICMIINFLQTRDPPVLPTLQQQCGLEPRMIDGFNVSFDKDLTKYKDFGKKNESSLGQLLFQFFRYYGFELDFEENVMSVRLGKILPKMQKGWHHLQDNRLCVEEPFNTSRNLGNTADDTSMRGIHLELRRAFGLIAKGKLEMCCEQYEPPKDESRMSEIFIPPVSRPIVTQAPAQPVRTPKGTNRGAKHGHTGRGATSGARRSSNPSGRAVPYLRNMPLQMTTQEMQLQAQHQQHLLHDRLFQQYQYLQAQEQELRMQLHQQSLLQGRMTPTLSYPQMAFPAYVPHDEAYADNSSSRASSVSRAPMSAPLHQQRFGIPPSHLVPVFPTSTNGSNPSSPHLAAALPAVQRYVRRSSVTQTSSGGSLRAQSQPARPMQPASNMTHMMAGDAEAPLGRHSSISSSGQDYVGENASSRSGVHTPQSYNARRPAEYIGYYIGQSPSISAYSRSAGISPVPSHIGLAIQDGGLSPQTFVQASRARLSTIPPLPDSQSGIGLDTETHRGRAKDSKRSQGLTIVSSSPPRPTKGHIGRPTDQTRLDFPGTSFVESNSLEPSETITFSASTSEDLAFDTPSSSDDQSQADLDHLLLRTEPTLPPLIPKTRPSNVDRIHTTSETPIHGNSDESNRAILSHSHGVESRPLPSWTKSTSKDENGLRVNGMRRTMSPEAANVGPGRLNASEQLSPVTEVQTPPPTRGALVPGLQGDANVPGRGGDPTIKPFGLSGGALPNTTQATIATGPTSNGSLSAVAPVNGPLAAGSTTGWQTQKKRKKSKKANKSEGDISALRTEGERAPLDERLRKGG